MATSKVMAALSKYWKVIKTEIKIMKAEIDAFLKKNNTNTPNVPNTFSSKILDNLLFFIIGGMVIITFILNYFFTSLGGEYSSVMGWLIVIILLAILFRYLKKTKIPKVKTLAIGTMDWFPVWLRWMVVVLIFWFVSVEFVKPWLHNRDQLQKIDDAYTEIRIQRILPQQTTVVTTTTTQPVMSQVTTPGEGLMVDSTYAFQSGVGYVWFNDGEPKYFIPKKCGTARFYFKNFDESIHWIGIFQRTKTGAVRESYDSLVSPDNKLRKEMYTATLLNDDAGNMITFTNKKE